MENNKAWQGAVAGMERAAEHANQFHENWEQVAYEFFIEFTLKMHEAGTTFKTEDVVEAAELAGLFAPDNRAWGAIAIRVKSAKIIKSVGMAYSKKGHGNSAPRTVWAAI